MTLKAPQSNGLTTVTSKFLLKLAMATLLLLSSPVFAQTKVTMQLRWLNQFQFAGYYAALHKNFYKNAGLDVTLKEGGPGISAINEVLAGHADFGVSTSGLVKDYLDGKPVLMLAPIIQHSPQVLLSLGKKLGNPADIARAGPVSLQPGDESLELKAIFINEGISLEKLKITSAGGLNDLVAGKIVAMNAYLSNEPFWLQRHGIVYSVIKPESYGMDFYSDVLFTTQAMEKTRPEIVASFRDATLKGWQYALDHPEEMIDLILTHYNTQGKSRDQLNFEAKTLINLISPDLVQIGYSNPGRWRHIADTFARFDLVPSDRDLKGFFYQADRKPDITWLYPYLAAALGILGIVSVVSFYICRINFRLHQAARNQAIVESRLRESELRYRVFFETAPSVALVWTEGYIVTDWNHRAEEIFGWKREEVLGCNYFDFLIPENEKPILSIELSELTRINTRPHAINTNLTRNGRVLTFEWFNAWLPEISGQPREVISLGLDITDRLKSDAAVAQLMKDLEGAERDQRQLLSVASHEFRTPAAMIKTSLDSLAIFKESIPPEVALRLENIGKASLRLNRLANSLISFDRLRELSLKPKMQLLDLSELAREVVGKYPENGKLQLQLPVHALLLEGDSILLGIALHNLIDNALRYHAATDVPIMVSLTENCTSGDSWIELRVADQGPGIPDTDKEAIFRRYYSAKGGQNDGLGLAIVKSIAQAHSGTAFVNDNTPLGAVFVIHLPILLRHSR